MRTGEVRISAEPGPRSKSTFHIDNAQKSSTRVGSRIGADWDPTCSLDGADLADHASGSAFHGAVEIFRASPLNASAWR